MSTKHQRKTQNSAGAVTRISQFPSPLFDEFVNLLPFSTNRAPGDMSFDPFFGPITPGFGTNPVNMPVSVPVDRSQSASVPMPMTHTAIPEPMVFPMESAATSSLSPTASHHSQRQGSTGGSYGSANPISALLIQNGEISQSSNPDGAFTISRRRMTDSSTSQRPWYETDPT